MKTKKMGVPSVRPGQMSKMSGMAKAPKAPTLKGESCTEYLGHFAQDKFLAMGHNDVEDSGLPDNKKSIDQLANEGILRGRNREDNGEGDQKARADEAKRKAEAYRQKFNKEHGND